MEEEENREGEEKQSGTKKKEKKKEKSEAWGWSGLHAKPTFASPSLFCFHLFSSLIWPTNTRKGTLTHLKSTSLN